MGLFGKGETKEDKQARKEQEMLAKYRLNDLSDPNDIESVRVIIDEMAGNAGMEVAAFLGGASEKDMMLYMMRYARTLVEQNFIMIRQLDRIAKVLQKTDAE